MKKKLFILYLLAATSSVNAQNVGIGTAAPQVKLHVVSSDNEALRLDAPYPYLSLYSGGVYQGYFWRSSNSIEIGSASGTNLPITFAPNGNPLMYLSTNGYVGIGTNNPNAPLGFPVSFGKKITLYPGATGDIGMAVQGNSLQIYADHPGADIAFGYDQGGLFTERMRMKNAGETGLELNGRIVLRNGTLPVDPDYGPGIWLNRADNSNVLGFMGTQNNQNIGFYGGPGGWGFTYDALNSRVGIGITSPAYPLHVTGNLSITGNFVNTKTSGGFGVSGSCISNSAQGTGVTGAGGLTGVYGDATVAGTGDRYGLFGIADHGTTNYGIYGVAYSGATAYGVYGQAGGAATNWAGYFSGSVYANVYSTSDRKLKKDIGPINGALSIINQLNPSFYTFKTTEYKQLHLPEGIHFGLISDEVQQVIPGIVKKAVQPAQFENPNEHSGKKLSDQVEFNAINYTEIIPILIAAMKEQQVMIDELRMKDQKIGQQQLQIDKQQQQINELKKLVEKLLK